MSKRKRNDEKSRKEYKEQIQEKIKLNTELRINNEKIRDDLENNIIIWLKSLMTNMD